jgi:hypothetical protein
MASNADPLSPTIANTSSAVQTMVTSPHTPQLASTTAVSNTNSVAPVKNLKVQVFLRHDSTNQFPNLAHTGLVSWGLSSQL